MKTSPYVKFDDYGLNHLIEHLYSLDDFKHLFHIVNDIAWYKKRNEKDLLREGYQRDIEFALLSANSNIVDRLSDLLSLKYLNGLVSSGSLNADQETMEIFLILGENTIAEAIEESIIADRDFFLTNNSIDDLDPSYFLDRCLHFLDTDQPLDALPYLNKLAALSQKSWPYKQTYKLFLIKRKIVERNLGDEYLKNIEPAWQKTSTFWKCALQVWEQIFAENILAAEETIALVFDALPSYAMQFETPNFREAKAVGGLLVIAELYQVLFSSEEAYNILELAWQEANYSKSQARGAAFRDLALAYAKFGYLTRAIEALKEIPEWLRFVQIECLEKIAVEIFKNGRSGTAKLLLLDAINHRLHNENEDCWLSVSFMSTLAKLGYGELAREGIVIYIGGGIPIGTTSNDWHSLNATQEILSSYVRDKPIGWFEILEKRDEQEKSLPEAKGIEDIKNRAEITIKEFRNRHDEIYKPIEDITPDDDVGEFFDSNPERFLALNRANITDAINSSHSATEKFGWNLIVRILICDAILSSNPSSEELSVWLKSIFSHQYERYYGTLDTSYDLIFYAPLLAHVNLVEPVLEKIGQVGEFNDYLISEQKSYLYSVRNILLDELKNVSNVTIELKSSIGISKSTVMQTKLSPIDNFREEVVVANWELESEGLPGIFIASNGNYQILDLYPDELTKAKNILSKYTSEIEFKKHDISHVDFLARQN